MLQHEKHEILVFGATGGAGAAIVRQALKHGFGITIFARDSGRARLLFAGLPLPVWLSLRLMRLMRVMSAGQQRESRMPLSAH